MTTVLQIMAEVKRLSSEGFGYEDIAVKLGLKAEDIRDWVIPSDGWAKRYGPKKRKAS